MPPARTRPARNAGPSKAPKRAPTARASKPTSARGAANTKAPVATGSRMTLADVMKALEGAGTEQTRKTYARHGATEPMFGVQFSFLAGLVKRIRVDHDLARALWTTGNFDARNLAMKLADPAKLTDRDLDGWARDMTVRMCCGYISMLAQEGGRGVATAERWLASADALLEGAGWGLVGQLAGREAGVPDAWFARRLDELERTIHTAPNAHRDAMNTTLILIGGRSPALRAAALAAAKRIGTVVVDQGDTSCKTPPAGPYIEKLWARAKAKGFESPTAQESARESPRTRC
jgi:hypothetical protein